MRDLENSRLDRKNVLNNKYALEVLEKDLDFKGYVFNNEICYKLKKTYLLKKEGIILISVIINFLYCIK